VNPLKPMPGVPRRFGKAVTDPPAPDSLPPDTVKDRSEPQQIVVRGHGMKVTIPVAIVSAAIGLAGSMMAQPHVDVSRLERKVDALDSKIGALSDSLDRSVGAVKERQASDSDKFTNAINSLTRIADKHDGQLERQSDRIVAIDRRVEVVERKP